MRMPADQLGSNGLHDVRKIERALLLRHASMENDLQKQIAQLVLQISQIVARDRIGNFIGFLERIGRNRAEVLLEVPRTSGARRAQRRHDFDQSGDIA